MPAVQIRTESEIMQRLTARVLARTDLTDLTDSSTVKHVLAAVSREMADTYYQLLLLRDVFDLRRVGGADLDARAAEIVPGLLRRRGPRRAVGRVVCSRATNTGTTLSIPVGTIVKVPGGSQYRTTQYGTIESTSAEVISGHGVGRDSGELSAVAVNVGEDGNTDGGTVTGFVTKPAGVSEVTNTTAFRLGRETELDDDFRARILAYVLSLVRCTPQALEALVDGVEDETSGKSVRYARIFEDPDSLGKSILYIDDGAGTAAEFDTPIGAEALVAAAEDGQQFATVAQPPFVENSDTLTSDLRGALVRGTDYLVNPGTGRVYFSPALTVGEVITAAYTPYLNLIPTVTRVIEGLRTNRVDYPGARAAGTTVLVKSPSVQNVAVEGTIVLLPERAVDADDLKLEVAQAIERYINTLGIGENVIVSELVDAAMSVDGIYDVSFTLPVGNVTILESELARASLATITIFWWGDQMLSGIGYHDPADFAGAVAHWRLDELVSKDLGSGLAPTFEDEIGGYDLQAESGTAQLTQLAPGLVGANFDQSVHLSHPNVAAALALTGDMALGLILVPHWVANEATNYVVRCGGLSTDPAVDRNSLWGFRIFGNGTCPVVFHDTAAPAAESFTDSAFALAHGLIQHVWISRISNVYRIWINRRLTISSPSGTLTAPGGGAAAKLRLGGLTPGVTATAFRGAIASLLLVDGTTGDADAETAFDSTVGLVLPRGLP